VPDIVGLLEGFELWDLLLLDIQYLLVLLILGKLPLTLVEFLFDLGSGVEGFLGERLCAHQLVVGGDVFDQLLDFFLLLEHSFLEVLYVSVALFGYLVVGVGELFLGLNEVVLEHVDPSLEWQGLVTLVLWSGLGQDGFDRFKSFFPAFEIVLELVAFIQILDELDVGWKRCRLLAHVLSDLGKA